MADNLMNTNLTIKIDNVSSVKNTPVTHVQKTETEKKPKQEPVGLENVIYTSEDGDTVQVKPEANERLSDGFVFNKSEKTTKEETIDIEIADKTEKNPIREEKENAIKEAEESAEKIEAKREERIKEMIKASEAESEKRKEEIKETLKKEAEEKEADKALDNKISFSGVSDSELERMYLTGRISSYDYNSAVESRKEEEASENRESAEISKSIGNAAADLEKNQTLSAAIDAQEKGSGYATKEENEAVKQAIFGTGKEDNTEGNGFEINIIR
ncbi:MAG: hypothetical protein IKI46_00930 [Lachnospiraceae bacterium]|nr:hypothetical protein [Lachnospiraceae bacterium]